MPRRLGEDAAHEVETVVARSQRQARFVSVFGRQLRHAARIDIGRVGDDQVVALLAERLEEIAAMERDAVAQPVRRHIAPRQRQRAGRQIDRVDPGAREGEGGEDRQAPRAGAEVEHTADLARIDRQRAVEQQIADEGARNQRPPVDVEPHAAHVGGTQQVGRRHAQRDARIDQGQQLRAFGGGRLEVEPRIERVDRQA